MHVSDSLARLAFNAFIILIAGILILACQDRNEVYIFGKGQTDGLIVDTENHLVIAEGNIFPHRYNTDSRRAHGHHAITWTGGGSARQALIETLASDYEIAQALRKTGAKAGRLLPEQAWTERDVANSPYPDWHAEGSLLKVEVSWSETENNLPNWHNLSELLNDSGGQGIEIRFQGQEELIPVWKSGCVVCMASCPGAKASNARYTIRDQYIGHMEFTASAPELTLPEDGTAVRIRFTVQ